MGDKLLQEPGVESGLWWTSSVAGDQKLPRPRNQRQASGLPIGRAFSFLPVHYLLQVATDMSPPLTSSPALVAYAIAHPEPGV